MNRYHNPIAPIDQESTSHVAAGQNSVTRPLGSLEQFEQLAIKLSDMLDNAQKADRPATTVFVADHVVAEANVSILPQVVNGKMATFEQVGKSSA